MSKKDLGQFYTTNAQYIIGDLVKDIPEDAIIVDPFAGNWDLLNLFHQDSVGYDIDPKNYKTEQRDSLLNPADYTGKWVITNPPYLAKNKTKNKEVFNKYNVSDLYKAAMLSIVDANGGILIIPVNFFSDEDESVRTKFLKNFKILSMNIFEESVFDDTDYTVCAFSFIREDTTVQTVQAIIYPSRNIFDFTITQKDGYRIGAEFYKLISQKYDIKIGRMVSFRPNVLKPTKLFLYAIDTGTNAGRIRLEYKEDVFYGINTDRAFATIGLSIGLSDDDAKIIVARFNTILETYRTKYRSLFLTNFRNSTASYSRKRIGFDAAYGLIMYIIENELKERKQ